MPLSFMKAGNSKFWATVKMTRSAGHWSKIDDSTGPILLTLASWVVTLMYVFFESILNKLLNELQKEEQIPLGTGGFVQEK